MDELTAFQRDVLYVVSGLDDTSAPAIGDELEAYYAISIHDGRLYDNLNTLADTGHLEKRTDEYPNTYVLTSRGRDRLASWAEWKRGKTAELSAERVSVGD